MSFFSLFFDVSEQSMYESVWKSKPSVEASIPGVLFWNSPKQEIVSIPVFIMSFFFTENSCNQSEAFSLLGFSYQSFA